MDDITRQKIARYYQVMPQDFRAQWDRLSESQKEAVFPFLDRFHHTMEVATWELLGGFIDAITREKKASGR